MMRCIKQPTSSVLKVLLLGCSLLLLSSSPALAQGCTQAEIKTNIARFNDDINNTTAKQAIVQCGSESVYLLIEALKTDKSAAVRERAAVALWSMGDEAYQAVPGLIQALRNDDSAAVRSKAASALGLMGEASYQAIPHLIDALKDKSAKVRAKAVYALGNLGKKTHHAVPDLIEALRNDQSVEVRANAAFALGHKKEAAKSAVPYLIKTLKDETFSVRMNSVNALEQIAEKTKDVVPQLIEQLRNDKSILIRIHATEILGEIAEPSKDALSILIELLEDNSIYVRYYAASALGNMGTEGIQAVPHLIILLKDESIDVRYAAASALVEIASKLGKQKSQLTKVQLQRSILEFQTVIKQLEQDTDKIFQDISIETVRGGLDDLEQEQDSRSYQKIFREGVMIWVTHMLFWFGLILAYPKSPQVQAIFFWNPWVRKFFGLGYVGIVLIWIPFLRWKLFAPFQESLLSDADLENFDEQAYFPNLEVQQKGKNLTQPIQEAIPALKVPIVLEGESGLGKSMFLRHLVKSSKRMIVYLPAEKCANGVIEAIQAKLHGFAQDSDFLRHLIYSDTLDICIDGLNGVTPDTRAKITSFVESYFKGNIIIGTQSMEWQTPSSATTYVLQPLKPKQIEKFLLSRYKILSPDASISRIQYKQACEQYIDTVLHEYQSKEERKAVRRMLSNPMELTIVAQMIAHGQKPDLLNLQQQQYQYMAEEYEQLYLRKFPLEAFAEAVYQMRLEDQVTIPADKWFEELICMERHKIVLCRLFVDHAGNPQKKWYFRHEKIQDFFIVQTFLGEANDLPNKHISDPRFRGVYFLLATLLPLNAALHLRETLIQYAANTKDHTVSDTFVQLLLSRQAA